MTGYKMFLKHYPDLSVRKSEGFYLARCQDMNRTNTASYFKVLDKTLNEND